MKIILEFRKLYIDTAEVDWMLQESKYRLRSTECAISLIRSRADINPWLIETLRKKILPRARRLETPCLWQITGDI